MPSEHVKIHKLGFLVAKYLFLQYLIINDLRTVPPFVSAHTFCISRNSQFALVVTEILLILRFYTNY